MGLIAYVLLSVLAVAALAVYQLVKSKKAVTVADVKTQVSADAAAVKADAKVVTADVKKV
jgi:hypothetical protein